LSLYIMPLVITKSDKTDKRYKAVFDGKKTIHFGSKGGFYLYGP